MPDIFDTVGEKDVFDLVSEPEEMRFDESGIPSDLPPREKRRFELLSDLAAEQKNQANFERSNRLLLNDSATGAVEGALTASSLSPSAIARTVERGISAIPAAIRGEQTFTPMPPVVSGFLNPEIEGGKRAIKIPEIPGGTSPFTQIPAGIANAAIEFANIFTTPEGILSLGIGGLPKAEQQAVVGTMAANMAAHYPQEFSEAIDAAKAGDLATATKKIIATPLMSSVMSRAAVDMPNLPKVPEFPTTPSPDVVARNLAEPGTVRPTERQAWSAPVPEAPSGLFSVGDVPFERLPRFGGVEAPRIIPKIAEQPVRILEPEAPIERGGQVSFNRGAEASMVEPTRAAFERETQQAIEKAKQNGLSEAAKAAEEVASYRRPKEFNEQAQIRQERQSRRAALEEGMNIPEIPMEPVAPEGMFPPEGMPKGTFSNLQRERILSGKENVRSNVRNNPPEPPVEPPSENANPPKEQGVVLGTKLESWADSVLSVDPRKKTRSLLDPIEEGKRLAAVAIKGAALIERGIKTFAEWSKSMVRDFGEDITPHLQKIWEDSWRTLENAPKQYGSDSGRKNEVTTVKDSSVVQPGVPLVPKLDLAERVHKMTASEFGKAAGREGELFGFTEMARAEGAKATDPASINRLYEMEQKATAEVADLRAKMKKTTDAVEKMKMMDELAPLSSKKQFFSEAIEEAVGVTEAAKKGMDTEQIAAAREAAGVPPTPKPDLIAKLESLKFDNVYKRRMYSLPHPDAIKTVGKALWNDALDIAIAAIKKGRAVGAAINEAVAHIKRNVSSFDEAKIRQNIDYILKEETEAKTPAPGSGTPTPSPAPASGTVTPNLERVYKIFEPTPEKKPTVGERLSKAREAVRTGFSSKFRPMNKIAEDIAKKYGTPVRDIAAQFESLKGSSGKAEADVYRFDKAVSDKVKGSEKDFSAYMFLRRSMDRLNQDAADVAAGKKERRAVADYSMPQLEADLNALKSKIGTEKLKRFEEAADNYQQHLDQSLRLQVESGRMAPEVYEAIKEGNQFYAPFKVMKYIEETTMPEGTGRRVDTTADLVKKMKGIEDGEFKLGDMLAAGRQNITMSRVLAEKNLAMRELSTLAPFDTDGTFIRKLADKQDSPKGMDEVRVMEGGEVQRYAVPKEVADAVRSFGPSGGAAALRMSAALFRAGVTSLNIPFQVANLAADIPRAALVSKTGIRLDKNVMRDLASYPMDLAGSLLSSMQANMVGKRNQLYLDYLDSGAAGTTVQKYLTPEGLKFKAETPFGKASGKTLNVLSDFANAIEETSKILGIKRAIKFTGAESGAQLSKMFPEMVTEVRRFSGSPDFWRMGKWTDQYRLNLLMMFLNARIQGTVADLGRLTGRDGAKTAGQTWLKLGTTVGLPTAALYFLNNSDEYREDYEKRPENERRNYWLIPKSTFITSDNGEKMRDYWRIPKRDVVKWVANSTEAALKFAKENDAESFWSFASTMAEDIAPVNIEGKTLQERSESMMAGFNPAIKGPLEIATGRDMYRHKEIVPDQMKKASPEQQYRDSTPSFFVQLAEKMPDVAPEVFRSPLMLENITKNFTGGLLTQFLPSQKPPEGRTAFENTPLLRRFQAVPFTDSTAFDEKIKKYEREGADVQVQRTRLANKIVDESKSGNVEEMVKRVVEQHEGDPKLAERVVDLWQAKERGITPQEKRVIALPTQERAKWIAEELKGKTPEKKESIIRDYALKRILTKDVAREMVGLGVEF